MDSGSGAIDRLSRLLAAPAGAANRFIHQPIGIAGRHRPLYALNVVDRIRGPRSLEGAVDGRVVVVTGASSGIGRATCVALGAAGATVALVARRAHRLREVHQEIEQAGGGAVAYPCDLVDTESVDALIAGVLEDHGRVDVLVNNAGHSIRRSIALSYDRPHDFERVMALNYHAGVRLVLGFLPGMVDRRDGQVVNISTAGVQARVPRFSGYVASKAALDAFSDAVQGEVRDRGVRFTTIHMPLVRTPMIAPSSIYDRFPALTPEEAADLVARAIVHRPRRVGPLYGPLASLADAISPEGMDLVRNRGFRMSADSRAARDVGGADEASGEPDRV